MRTTALIPALPFLHTNQNVLAAPAEEAIAENGSYVTLCPEEDNINVRLRAKTVKRFRVVAQHPTYEIGDFNTPIDSSACAHVFSGGVPVDGSEKKIFWDDGKNVIEIFPTDPNWWRPFRMNVQANNNAALGHWIVLATRIKGLSRPAQFFVLYEDGYMRLTPYPPVGRPYWFGSSVIIGPAAPAKRPYVDIQGVRINLATRCVDISYREGGTAHLCLSVNRTQAVADVQIAYDTSHPFATLRSMWVEDGNSDVAHIQTQDGDFPILSGWTTLKGPRWFFHRKIRSRHNTLAPDIRIEVMP